MKSKKHPRLADFLKSSRESSGLTQKNVADKFGYSTSQFISEWERGIRSPPAQVLRRLVDLYEIDPEQLYEIMLEEQTRALEKQLKKDLFG